MRILLVLLFMTGSSAYANDLRGVFKNNQGVKRFTAEKPVEAMDDFTSALADMPYSPELHYNIGNTFLHNKELDKALSEYGLALKQSPGDSSREKETRFRAYFNSAVAMTMNKQTDQALELYQQALDLKPDSLETKTNIELLTQGGSGDGDGDKDNDKKDDKKGDKKKDGDGKDQKQKPPEKFDNPKPTPHPFPKDKEVSEQDVKRILEELKRQEEQIRARMQQGQAKEGPAGKDW